MGRGVWAAKAAPPLVDSRGSVEFIAGEEGPTGAQFEAYDALVGTYAIVWPDIASRLFAEYRTLAENEWPLLPANSHGDMMAVTRLACISVRQDCSIVLTYLLYFHHNCEKRIEQLDHVLNLIIRHGKIEDMLLEG